MSKKNRDMKARVDEVASSAAYHMLVLFNKDKKHAVKFMSQLSDKIRTMHTELHNMVFGDEENDDSRNGKNN